MKISEKISALLKGQGGNYILPFFWQHGEDEDVLRHYMEKIHECGIGAVCVESRPHPDFCGPLWWRDMDIILDEARKRSMKVWILDDSHFPTGYANGALKYAPVNLRRQSVSYNVLAKVSGGETVAIKREWYEKAKPFEKSMIEQYVLNGEPHTFDDDRLLGVMAVKTEGQNAYDIIRICESDGQVNWTAPEGSDKWKIYALHLTRNRGPHRDYINMLDAESCKKLIEAVYEPHFVRYKNDFGKTIAGFFSDEPELGNGHLYETGKNLPEVDDQPWSNEIEMTLKDRWGENWSSYLPLILENDFDAKLKAKVRYDYMDVVTRCVEKAFSYQIGDWCRERGVEYIGHVIEDDNQHSRTGSSLGHFFRGLAGQDMAGIDNIGGQVLPQGEEIEMMSPTGGKRDGTFYHYALGKLGASAAAIEPLKRGRAMCENFGNYGWEAGVHLMKYLADHFMVRGINHYVPHAFSPKAFPDPDCPPHFYAHGHNPQFRHFGMLMRYMNRICELINDGRAVTPAAILYHGEADWTGGGCMFSQEPAKVLADRQIDYHFIPSDVFVEEKYKTILGDTLKINNQEYKVLIVPETSFVTAEFAQAAADLTAKGFPVVFINKLPDDVCNGDSSLIEGVGKSRVVALDGLTEFVDSLNLAAVQVSPSNNRLRYLHYVNGENMYYFFNEGADTYKGKIEVKSTGKCYAYNAWDNVLETVDAYEDDGKTIINIQLEPRKSLVVVFGTPQATLCDPIRLTGEVYPVNEGWSRSFCTSKAYPSFEGSKVVNLPDKLEEDSPKFAGFARYEKEIELSTDGKTVLEVSDAAEGVEVFVNGASAGIQIVPAYVYDITNLVRTGKNHIAIEVATTLERAVEKRRRHPSMPLPEPANRCGLCGMVTIWTSNTKENTQ